MQEWDVKVKCRCSPPDEKRPSPLRPSATHGTRQQRSDPTSPPRFKQLALPARTRVCVAGRLLFPECAQSEWIRLFFGVFLRLTTQRPREWRKLNHGAQTPRRRSQRRHKTTSRSMENSWMHAQVASQTMLYRIVPLRSGTASVFVPSAASGGSEGHLGLRQSAKRRRRH